MFVEIESFSGERHQEGPLQGHSLFGVLLDDATGLRWLTFPTVPANLVKWQVDQIDTHGASGALIFEEGQYHFVSREAVHRGGTLRWNHLASVPGPEDIWIHKTSTPFVHLHTHSEFSALDGLSTVDEIVEAAQRDGQGAIAITDHGVCSAHPKFSKVATAAGVKPIFGLEAYLVDHRQDRSPEKRYDYWHLILLAENNVGLRNLWASSTEANMEGLYGGRPRMDWDTLTRHSEGLICSTACLRGPLSTAIKDGDEELALERLHRLQGIFGDRLYLELHTNQIEEQKQVNWVLNGMGRDHSIPTIVVSDSHYACVEDRPSHQLWMAIQTDRTLQDEAALFSGDQDYHVHSADEVAAALKLGGDLKDASVAEAMANTVSLAERCHATIEERKYTPVFHRKALPGMKVGHEKDAEELRRMCLDAWDRKVGWKPNQEVYRERLEIEMDLLVSKNFCGYMLIEADLCHFAKSNGVLMGPGRGSAAGSLVCYLADITEVDPVEARLLFERFLTPGRTSLPDIDSDFPASKRSMMINYVSDRWGADRSVRVGTHLRLRNRGVMRDVARALGESVNVDYMDIAAVTKIIEEAESGTAGLGLSWEELWAEHEELLAPYKAKYPVWFEYAEKLVGRLKSYGKHAAGVVIDPEQSILDRLPLRVGEEAGQPITEFDMEALEILGFVKFDILTLRTLDTIQLCLDIIRGNPSFEALAPDIYSWGQMEYDDPQVWDMLCDGDTVGIFQIETVAGTNLTKEFQPRSMDDLCAILTLVRPGPQRSGLKETYLRRRRGDEQVIFAHPLLERVLDKTYGTMIYQEDIMAVCRVLAGYTMEQADEVRSILGKKKVDKVQAEGVKFVARCIEHDISEDVANILWAQMAEFAKYAFNRSHSWSYAMVAYWCAWFKLHYPVEYIVAALTTVDKDRISDFVDLARRKYRVLPPDINESGHGFSVGKDRLSIRYGLDSVKGIAAAALAAIMQGQPYTSFDDFMERKGRACNIGHVEILASLGAFDSILPEGVHRAMLEARLRAMKDKETDRCTFFDSERSNFNLPCQFDWESEVILGPSGKPVKKKPPPKKCTKACRNYTKRDLPLWPEAEMIDPSIMRWRERRALGVFLSSTPFEVFPTDDWKPTGLLRRGSELDIVAEEHAAMFPYLVTKVKPYRDKNGRMMGFVDGIATDEKVSLTFFSSSWTEVRPMVHPDALVIVQARKSQRGWVGFRVAYINQKMEKEEA